MARKSGSTAASRRRAAAAARNATPEPVPVAAPDVAARAVQTAADMSDRAVEEALRTGDDPGLLETLFGSAGYAQLRALAREAAARSVRGGERVLILPGIMGSKLGFPG